MSKEHFFEGCEEVLKKADVGGFGSSHLLHPPKAKQRHRISPLTFQR